jgi:hypothetical protein
MKKTMFSRLVFSTVLAGGLFLSACQKESPIPTDAVLKSDKLFNQVVDLNVEASRPTVKRMASFTTTAELKQFQSDAKIIEAQLKANPTEENKQLAATFLGFESVEQYNALNKPFLESLAKLTEKYPALRKMKEAELKELYGKALTDDVRYTDMVNQEIGNRGNSVLKNICLLAVTAGTIAANTLLCAPLGFPLGQLCNLGISLAAQALNGLCDLL